MRSAKLVGLVCFLAVAAVIAPSAAWAAAPVANDDSYTMQQGRKLTVAAPGLLANDTDADGDTLQVDTVSTTDHGVLTAHSDGSFTYWPDRNFSGTDSFGYRVTDGTNISSSARVIITVTPAGAAAPVTQDDSYSTPYGRTLTVPAPGVLANDSDPDGDAISVWRTDDDTPPGASVMDDGSLTYTPPPGFVGTVSFHYYATDGVHDSNMTLITITVLPPGDAPPVAVDDSYTVLKRGSGGGGGSWVIPAAQGVLANDGDPDGDPITVKSHTDPAHGGLTLSSDGTITYTPDYNFVGTDSFAYNVTDSANTSNLATVTITVVDEPPVAQNDSYRTVRDAPITIAAPEGVLANDSDANHDPLTAVDFTSPSHGTVVGNADGSFTYTPAPGYVGGDDFTYRASDGGQTSSPATVHIEVRRPDDSRPVAQNDTYTTSQGTTLTVPAPGVLGNDSDADGDSLQAEIGYLTAHGTVSLQADGSFTYTPELGFVGTDSFTYLAYEDSNLSDNALSNPATVTITVTPVPGATPVANDDSYTLQGAVLTVAAPGVLGNDSDADGDALRVSDHSAPAKGSLTIHADGSFTYEPFGGSFVGTDTFTYLASDGVHASAPATVTITGNPPGAATPVANDDSYTVQAGTTLTVAAPGLLGNDSDPDGDGLLMGATFSGSIGHGALSTENDGSFTYTPDPGFTGADSFTYYITDGAHPSNYATVTITVTPVDNTPPSVTINQGAGQADPTGDPAIVFDVVFSEPVTGFDGSDVVLSGTAGATTATVSGSGTTYTVTVTGMSASGTVIATIPAGAAEDLANNPSLASTSTDNSVTWQAPPTDNTPPSVTINQGAGQADPASGPTIVFDVVFSEPVTGFDGSDVVLSGTAGATMATVSGSGTTYTVTVTGMSANGTVIATIPAGAAQDLANNPSLASTSTDNSVTWQAPATAPPVAADDSYATQQDTPLTVPAPGILGNDSDPDGDTITVHTSSTAEHGTVAVQPDGAFTYQPDPAYVGSDSFTYWVTDGAHSSNVATVTITIVPALPVLATVAPASGPVAGGAVVTLTGTHLSGATTVTLGGVAATNLVVVSDTQLTATVPAHAAGPVDVSVTTPGGTATLPGAFTYIAPAFAFVPPSGSLPSGTAGVPYAQAISVTGGTGPYAFSATGLPDGLAIDPRTGTIYGLPSMPGSFTVTLTVRDRDGLTGTATYGLAVDGIARPDPSDDPEVTGLINAQAQASERFATAQIDNFNERLERLHDEMGQHGQAIDIRVGMTPDSGAMGYVEQPPVNDPAGLALGLPAAGQPAGGAPPPVDALFGDTAFWAGGFINFGTSERGMIDLGHTLVGVSGGVDHRFAPDFVAGIGFGYGRDHTDIGGNGTESTGQAFSTAIYGSYHPAPFYLDGLLGISRLDFDSTRFVTATGDFADGNRDGTQVFGSLSAGYEYRDEGFLLAPYGRLQAAFTQLDGFTETGAGPYNLAYGAQSFDMLAGVVGLRTEYAMPMDWGVLTARGRLEYTHDFAGSSQASIGYADLGTLPYAFDLDAYLHDYLTIGLGLDAKLDDGVTLSFDYQTATGFDGDAQNHTFGFRLVGNF